jgi:hypothetical protein
MREIHLTQVIWVCGGPHKKMCGGYADELGNYLVNEIEKDCCKA